MYCIMIRIFAEVFHHLKKVLSDGGMSTNVGDEGGFAWSPTNNLSNSTISNPMVYPDML